MSIRKQFTNAFGHELSEAQASKQENYTVRIFEDNILKRAESYSSGNLVGISYNVFSTSEIPAILNVNPNASFEIESQQNSYTLTECLDYNNLQMVGKQIFVTQTVTQNTICRHMFNPQTNQLIHSRTIKNYYDHDGLEIYSFDYNDDGTCFMINKVQEFQGDIIAKNIGIDPDIDFSWQDFQYYEFSEPLVPLGDVL